MSKLHDDDGSAKDVDRAFSYDLYHHLTTTHGVWFTAAELAADGNLKRGFEILKQTHQVHHQREEPMTEHELITETVTVKPSLLAAYADEPDDAISDQGELDAPQEAVRLACSCGAFDGWAEVGEDVSERFARHVTLSAARF